MLEDNDYNTMSVTQLNHIKTLCSARFAELRTQQLSFLNLRNCFLQSAKNIHCFTVLKNNLEEQLDQNSHEFLKIIAAIKRKNL